MRYRADNALHWVGCCVTPRLSNPHLHHHSWCRVEVSRSHLGLTLTSTTHTLYKSLLQLFHKLFLTSLSHLSRFSLTSLSHFSHLSGPKAGHSAILCPPFSEVSTPTPLILLTPLIPASPLTAVIPLTLTRPSQIRLPHRTSHHHPGCIGVSHLPPASQTRRRKPVGARAVASAAPGGERRESDADARVCTYCTDWAQVRAGFELYGVRVRI